MCGIAGSIGKNVKVSKFNIKQLNDTLNHRGPDFQLLI